MHCIERLGWGGRTGCWLTAAAITLAGCADAPLLHPHRSDALAPAASAHSGSRSRSMQELQRHAAKRLISANPEGTYLSAPPETLLAIPVLEVELYGNGSIKHIKVLRYPRQAPETTQMAIDAVRRAAPFGDVQHLPKPWSFVEVFLFRDDKRFKPRTLDD